MSFLAPLLLGLGIVAGAVVFGLHLITTRRPPPAPLPTARFVPVSEARAVSRASRPTDLMLLALRLLAVVLIGAAFARPVLDAAGPAVRSVVLLDVSAAVADPAAARDTALARLTPGGALVVFDTAALEVGPDFAILSDSVVGAEARGALSPALLLGLRAATRIARGADSVRLVVVSPITLTAEDAATRAIRAGWPGGIQLARVAARADTARAGGISLRTDLADDALVPAVARLTDARGTEKVRITRSAPGAADSAWVRGGDRVLVHWPIAREADVRADALLVPGPRAATLVAPLARLPLAAGSGTAAQVLVRWRDGAPAATQERLGRGCLRRVAIGLPAAGDLTLRPAFDALLSHLAAPCAGRRAPLVADDSLAWLRGPSAAAAPAPALASAAPVDSPAAAWLLAAALLALAAEWVIRRRAR